jgi:hypothetical protein
MLLQSIERSPLKINVRENRRDNQEWKIQDEDKLKQKTQHNTETNTNNMNKTWEYLNRHTFTIYMCTCFFLSWPPLYLFLNLNVVDCFFFPIF